jgi:hypothetical protein
MERNKIIGILMAWGVRDWIRPALDQALEYCDEVLVIVTPFGPTLRRYEDETCDICKKYKGIKLLDYEVQTTNTKHAVCEIANHMLKNSDLFMPGNWVWILDADEFHLDSTYREIRSAIEDGGYDWITIESRLFYINMQHYLNEVGERLFKIMDMNDKFGPTLSWQRKPRRPYVIKRESGMFHYSMLTNTRRHSAKWRARGDLDRAEWLDKIYVYYDLRDEERWTNENMKLCGIKSPWFNLGAIANKEGKLFKYEGRHPKFIERAGLPRIKDFRHGYCKNIGGKSLGGDNYSPRLNLQTVAMLEKIITPESLILETGSGNSTIWFALRAARVISLESDISWYNAVQGHLEKEGLRNTKIYVDPEFSQKSFIGVLEEEDAIQYDIVLLDGPNPEEARVPLLLEDAPGFVKPGGYLVVDDTHYEIFKPGIKYLDSLGWEKTEVPMGEDRWGSPKEAIIYRKPEGGS